MLDINSLNTKVNNKRKRQWKREKSLYPKDILTDISIYLNYLSDSNPLTLKHIFNLKHFKALGLLLIFIGLIIFYFLKLFV